MFAYVHNATDREARDHNLVILELRTKPNGRGKFLYSATALIGDRSSLEYALASLDAWCRVNGYTIVDI